MTTENATVQSSNDDSPETVRGEDAKRERTSPRVNLGQQLTARLQQDLDGWNADLAKLSEQGEDTAEEQAVIDYIQHFMGVVRETCVAGPTAIPRVIEHIDVVDLAAFQADGYKLVKGPFDTTRGAHNVASRSVNEDGADPNGFVIVRSPPLPPLRTETEYYLFARK